MNFCDVFIHVLHPESPQDLWPASLPTYQYALIIEAALLGAMNANSFVLRRLETIMCF